MCGRTALPDEKVWLRCYVKTCGNLVFDLSGSAKIATWTQWALSISCSIASKVSLESSMIAVDSSPLEETSSLCTQNVIIGLPTFTGIGTYLSRMPVDKAD